MTAAFSLFSLVTGAGLAWRASSTPAHAEALETWGGTLLVVGLALLGFGLRRFV